MHSLACSKENAFCAASHSVETEIPLDNHDEQIRRWLLEAMRATKLKATPFAKEAGLSPSTLLRALDKENPVTLERRSIKKIVDRFHLPWPPPYSAGDASKSSASSGQFITGFGEEELVPVSDHEAELGDLSPTQGVWQVGVRTLDLMGILEGDFVLADSAVQPRPHDIVVAQIVRKARPGADTVLRMYDPPYLLTVTMRQDLMAKPVLVDNVNVSVWGVVVRSWRVRGY